MIYIDADGVEHDVPADEPDDSFPLGVGPHEGREYDLMMSGQKHVALFSEWRPKKLDDLPETDFACDHWVELAGPNNDIRVGTWIYYRLGYEDDVRFLKSLRRDGSDAAEHETGRILGYTRAQVDAFLRHRETLRRIKKHQEQ